ncbi:uncharacterized protein PV09_06499 [Verruconis gallopava]|uniref:Uncharacterized protein n=1 Tax=Verruconis gallopava TaxID=253628 RepID=A0A0D2AS43_9PEZI|nr:uncharacterized protein PV09_06499 [Verruconis gallopava]KIW01989.1 hypothetical protein PV09_06499 [Verruconis gallopava]
MDAPEKTQRTAKKRLPENRPQVAGKGLLTDASVPNRSEFSSRPVWIIKRKLADATVSLYQANTGGEHNNNSKLDGNAVSTAEIGKPRKAAKLYYTHDVSEAKSKGKESSEPENDEHLDSNDKPIYRSTQKPIGTMLCESPTGSCWKVSSDVSVAGSSILPDQGTMVEYNLSQMNHHWIKILVRNLKDVAQVKCSVRGWKKTLLYSLGAANIPDQGDIELEKRIAQVKKQLRKGKVSAADADSRLQRLEEELDSWVPGWQCEPLYELKIFRSMSENTQIIIVQLSSTHGELFIRTERSSATWIKFFDWLNVKQANMHGYSSRRKAAEWNGFEIEEKLLVNHPSIVAQLIEMERLFLRYQCVAIWKTKPQNMGVEY